jgi:peptidoglycan hydrolase FlgJ
MTALLPPDSVLLTRATPQMRQAAQNFEAQALSQLLAPAFATVDLGRTPFGGGMGESQWQPMLVDAIAKGVARAGGLGLAQPVLHEMLRIQAARENPQ